MPTLNVTVTRGYTAVPGVPITLDDLNAGFMPVVVIDGELLETVTPSVAQPGPYWTATATGSGGTYAVTLTPAPTTLEVGLWCSFKANHANPGAATLNLNTLGAVAIQTPHGQALVGGEIQSGQEVWVQYTGTVWQMVSTPTLRSALYAVDSGAANAYVISIPGIALNALSSLVGQQIVFKAAAANTGAATLAVNGLTARAITKKGSTALSANDIQTGAMVSVVYDGTSFQLASFVEAPSLPAVGAAGTHTRPYSITVDAQGRVTGVAGAASNIYEATHALPAAGAAVTFTHGLGRVPQFVDVSLRLTAASDATSAASTTYAQSDEISILNVERNGGSSACFMVTRTSTAIIVARASSVPSVLSKTGASDYGPIDPSDWELVVRAS